MQRVWFLSCFLMGLVFPIALSWPQEDYKKMLPDTEGKQMVIELCGSSCHNLQKVVTSRKTDKEWERSVYDMVSRGAQIFPEEVDQIVKYLAKSFPSSKTVTQ
ncbi:MAG TPA: hypothetical protein VE689_09420 [Candidatus Udaeobacter sp.]|nr:hypothetical protein [Candidatus Udaeobacter sp.]